MEASNSESLKRTSEVREVVRQSQREMLSFALPLPYLLGLVLIASATGFEDPLRVGVLSALLFLLPLGVGELRKTSYLASAWLLVTGCLAINLLVVVWAPLHVAICLLALPAGLATLFVGRAGGLVVATACSALALCLPTFGIALDGSTVVVALVGVWSAVGLVWLTLYSLLPTIQWSWSSYIQSRDLLEEARDYQVRLGQASEDLTAANLQLTRLNQVAQGLRLAAEEARRAKEQFVANVSHELRTPLNMIIGFSQMMVRTPNTYGGKIPRALLADLSVVLRNSQHLSSLIDDVLDLSQIETGHMALTKERADVAEMVEAAIVAVRPLFDSKGLYLVADLPEGLPLVFCDSTRIREVIVNLLSNAGRFTEHGGVHLRVVHEEGIIVVSVTDTGPGIAAEQRERLFQPFQQLDGSIRRRHGGSGLGLSISKSFVELHDGQIWLDTETGVGTTFYFRLPIDPPPPMESGSKRWLHPYWHYDERTRSSTVAPPATRSRFLVLESGSTLRRLLTRYRDGAEIVPVQSLEETYQELSCTPAQALLVNAASVSETLQQLNTSAELPFGTPAIVCSIPGIHEAAEALGVSDYLMKPVSRETLLAALDRLRMKGNLVLVADDEPDALRLFRRVLTSAERGYRVVEATNGLHALEILRSQHPGVILLDLVMPEMDGFRLLEAKNADPALRDIPVLVTSARDPSERPSASNALGVMNWGGISASQLLDCVEALSEILAPGGQASNPGSREENRG